ncbi:hypothetical protein [Streptomyces sp. TBY4]|uniref:hypothetical protein n=1 Tax=Streptomyces sp. TBY4 TaxID=2962030 RepID=UPI0020B8AF98|nr:hypothetical protein [Streptomyces sp. TBY4]MCP3758182.1 hypothetical protein [Streptomyces sp. TBY4]
MSAPTPLDVAARVRRAHADGFGSSFRGRFQQGIRCSQMLPQTRLVALTLASLASDSGEIDASAQPGLMGLVAATGLTPGRAAVNLRILEQRGWLQPLRGSRYETTVFTLTLPLYRRTALRE